MRTGAFLTVVVAAGGGCMWTDFDQLKDDVWVDSVDGVAGSAKYGEALMEATDDTQTAGTTVAVLGRNTVSISGLVYQQDGTRTISPVDLPSRVPLINVFDEFPAVAADPTTRQFAFAALTGIATDANRGLKVGLFDGADFDGTAYEPLGTPIAANTNPPTAMTFGPAGEALIGRRDQLLHVSFAAVPGAWAGCSFSLSDDETAYALAYGDVTGDLLPEWVVASAPIGIDGAPDPGRIWYFRTTPIDATGAAACPEPGAAEVLVSGTGGADFPFGGGTHLVIADLGAGPRVVVSSPGTGGRLSIVDFTGATPAFTQITGVAVGDIGPVAVADITEANPGVEIIVGAPGADDAGPTRAGAVRILKPDGTPAVAANILYDADPETEQHYGKSLLVVPFGPVLAAPAFQPKVLVVGAEGEVFTYFRTSFYADVRAGR